MFAECGNLELLGRRKRGRTHRLGVTKEAAMDGGRSFYFFNYKITCDCI